MARYTASQRRMYGAARRAARARARAKMVADPNYIAPSEPRWYSIKRETWMRFIEHLKTIRKPAEELTEEERNLWDCYYIAKEHGRNEKGLLELPWKRRQTVNRFADGGWKT